MPLSTARLIKLAAAVDLAAGKRISPDFDPLDATVAISFDQMGVEMWKVVALQSLG